MRNETRGSVRVRTGQIVVRDVSETRLRTAFPDCEVAAVGADFQITFEVRDLADTYGFLDRVRQTGASLVRLSITESPSSDYNNHDSGEEPIRTTTIPAKSARHQQKT